MTSPSQESLLSALIFASLLSSGVERQVLVRSYVGFGHQIDVPRRSSEPIRVLLSEQDDRPLADIADDLAAGILFLTVENETRIAHRSQPPRPTSQARHKGRRVHFEEEKPTDKQAAKRAERKRLRQIARLTAQMLSAAQQHALQEEN